MIHPDKLRKILEKGNPRDVALLKKYLTDPYYNFTPRPDAPLELDEQTSFVGSKHSGITCVIAGNACLGPSTLVRMYDGSTKMAKDVVVGDQLMGPDSTPRTVLKLHSGMDEMYRVMARGTTPESDLNSYIVNKSHILSLKKCGERMDDGNRGTRYIRHPARMGDSWIYNISVEDYLKESDKFRFLMMGYRSTPIEYAYRSISVDPYFLGVWLGDGSSNASSITTMDDDTVNMIYKEAESRGMKVSINSKENNKASTYRITNGTGQKNPLLAHLQKYDVINNKHIPQDYLSNTIEIRRELLAGLIDSDGNLSNGIGFDFINKNKTLATQVCLLARSLGLRAVISPCRKECVNNGVWGDYFRVYISGDCHEIHTRLYRKQAENVKDIRHKNPLNYGITITPLGLGEYAGFELDGDHLFLLADYTVTHNSGKSFNSAWKVANFLRTNNPPTDLCKYFVASQTMSMVGTLWSEKLSKFIPETLIEDITYWNSKENHPKCIIMKPSKNGNRWMILFRSYEQGRKSFQAVSECAGFWCDEQLPNLNLLNEIDTRTREFSFVGSKIYSLTPLEPDEELQERFENQKDFPYWHFYRMNAQKNFEAGGISNLDWLENTSEDMKETRRVGEFMNFEGAIYKEFDPKVHVLSADGFKSALATWEKTKRDDPAVWYRVIDFGYIHDTAVLLACKLGEKIYVVQEWGASGMLIHEKVEIIKKMVPHNGSLIETNWSDYEDAQQKSEFARLGIQCTNAKKNPVLRGIDLVQQKFKSKNLLIVSDCKKLISQTKNARWYKSGNENAEKPNKERPVKKDDDYADCLRMLVHSLHGNAAMPWDMSKKIATNNTWKV